MIGLAYYTLILCEGPTGPVWSSHGHETRGVNTSGVWDLVGRMVGNAFGCAGDILLEVRTPLLKWGKALHVGIELS
jgi:hypothetical protein